MTKTLSSIANIDFGLSNGTSEFNNGNAFDNNGFVQEYKRPEIEQMKDARFYLQTARVDGTIEGRSKWKIWLIFS